MNLLSGILPVNTYWKMFFAISLACFFSVSHALAAQEAVHEHGEGEPQAPMTDVENLGPHTDLDHAEGHGAHIGEPAVEPGVVPDSWRVDMSVYSLLVFLVLLGLLSKFVWGPIVQGLDAREQSIQNNINAAEQSRIKAEQMLADYKTKLDSVQDEVREIVAEARRDADHTKNEIIATAQKEADLVQKRATDEIERARDRALNELFSTMSAQVTATTEHLLGRAIDSNDRDRLVQEALSQLGGQAMRN